MAISLFGLWLVLFAMATAAARLPTATVCIEVHLQRAHADHVLHNALMDRSIVGRALYGKHLTVSELAHLTRPVPGAASALESYLSTKVDGGSIVRTLFRGNDVVQVSLVVGSSAFAAFIATDDSREGLVPVPLKQFVASVVLPRTVPSPDYHITTTPSTTSLTGTASGMLQNPFTIAARYAVPNTTLGGNGNTAVTQALIEYLPGSFSQRALNAFNAHYGLFQTQVRTATFGEWSTDSGDLFAGQGATEYITAMAQNATTWWVGPDSSATWTAIGSEIAALEPLPAVVVIHTLSSEYGFLTNYSDPTWTSTTASIGPVPPPPAAYLAAETSFLKLGLLGVTIVVSSGGASGPGSWGNQQCGIRFGPLYPSSSQYVLSVGSTYANGAGGDETATSWSGGGFSEFTSMPSWQKTAVRRYLSGNQAGMPPANLYNAKGRAYPDVAALSTNFATKNVITEYTNATSKMTTLTEAWARQTGAATGVSIFAGILTRVAQQRLSEGRPALGFVTPALYALGSVGFDVVKGKTGNGCYATPSTSTTSSSTSTTSSSFTSGTSTTTDEEATSFDQTTASRGPGYGFPAAAGWDAATGLGTPNLAFLLKNL